MIYPLLVGFGSCLWYVFAPMAPIRVDKAPVLRMEGKTLISTWASDPLPQTIVSSQRHRRPVRGIRMRYNHLTKPVV